MQESYAVELIRKNKRIDGRKFDEFRNIELKKNVIAKAEGSAHVKLGETQIIAGVKMNVGTPFPDTPNEGILVVNAEFTPLASPDFESGPPSENAVELARIVDRALRESKCIELEKLGISEEKVLSVFVDIFIMNHQGNLVDAAALASIAALHETRIPKIEDEKIIRGEYEKKLPIVHKPIVVTINKITDKLLIDPTFQEEIVAGAKLSVATREDEKICAMQKQGKSSLTFKEVEEIVDIALAKGKELRKLI